MRGRIKGKQDYMVVKAQSYSPVDLNRHSTHKTVYLAPTKHAYIPIILWDKLRPV